MRIQINSSLACCVLVTTLWLVCDADAWGAGCSRPDISALKKAILTTDDRDVILMAAAIGQEEVLPELRKRMKPIDFQSPEGAAEAAAARLGDAKAIGPLRRFSDLPVPNRLYGSVSNSSCSMRKSRRCFGIDPTCQKSAQGWSLRWALCSMWTVYPHQTTASLPGLTGGRRTGNH